MIGSSNVEDSKETLFSFLEKHNAEIIINDKTQIIQFVLIFSSQADFVAFKIQLSFIQADHILIKWLLLS